jgi:5-formyltetrahydrofolate cyclo-ligase
MEKQKLRIKYKEKRRELSPGDLSRRSEKVINLALSSFPLAHKTVSLFLPIERQKEINTYTFWEKLISMDALVAIPKVNPAKSELKHMLLTSHSQLETSDMGIPEPKTGKIIAAHKIDVVFVPLLAFDKAGNRVGYGGGFYDRFLKKCNPHCLFIGLSHFSPEKSISGINQFDIPLKACVTPDEVFRF